MNVFISKRLVSLLRLPVTVNGLTDGDNPLREGRPGSYGLAASSVMSQATSSTYSFIVALRVLQG